MSEEIFDVVDSDDNVTGQAARSVVHANGWLHRAVHIFVLNSAGELLTHLRSTTRDEYPNKWTSSASGHLSAGEDYDEAAPRELKEELGISAPLTRLHKFAACPDTANEHTILYMARTDAPPTFQAEEIADGEFLPLATIRQQMEESPDRFAPSFRLLFCWFDQSGHATQTVLSAEHIVVRPAQSGDEQRIAAFIHPFVEQKRLLPRTEDELDELIKNGFVALDADRIVGFAALEIYSRKLAEIRSLATAPEFRGMGIGKRLIQACVNRAKDSGVLEVMAITSSEEFFRSCGFDFTLPGEKKALFLQAADWSV